MAGTESEPAGEISIGLNTAEGYEEEIRDILLEPRSTVTMLQIHLAGFITCTMEEYIINTDSFPHYRM